MAQHGPQECVHPSRAVSDPRRIADPARLPLGVGNGLDSLLDTRPLAQTAQESLDTDQIAANVASGAVDAVGVGHCIPPATGKLPTPGIRWTSGTSRIPIPWSSSTPPWMPLQWPTPTGRSAWPPRRSRPRTSWRRRRYRSPFLPSRCNRPRTTPAGTSTAGCDSTPRYDRPWRWAQTIWSSSQHTRPATPPAPHTCQVTNRTWRIRQP